MLLGVGEPRLETRIEWLGAPDAWVIALLVIPAIFFGVWWVYAGERGKLTTSGRWILGALRFLVILTIVAILFRPTLTEERVQRENSWILLLVDDSYSMGISDRFADPTITAGLERILSAPYRDDTSRLDLVTALLGGEAGFVDALREKANVRVVSCSNGIELIADLPRTGDENVDPAAIDLSGLELRGRVTRLGDSLYESVNELRGESVSAVVLFSDGRDNGGVVRPEEAASRLARREVPIFTIGVGNPDEPRDIRVFNLEVAEIVLVGDEVPVDFQVSNQGFTGENVRVDFTLVEADAGERVVARKSRYLTLGEEGDITPGRIEFTPETPGSFRARVEIAAQEGELFRDNNFDEKPLRVLDEKIKVLYVEGPPRFDYRFLSHALTRDPTMEAQILLTSADPEYVQESSAGISPISRFPRTRMELFEYHVVIVGDLPESYLTTEQMEWLVEFVDDHGGGVVFIAGRWSLPSRYRGTPIEKLFPVELEDAEATSYDGGNITSSFNVRLTPEGKEHPVMQLVGDPEENDRLWQFSGRFESSMPGYFWFQRVKRVKRGAVPLAVHPGPATIMSESRPIFAYQYYGRGRTFISLTDDTWRVRKLVGNKYFYRFWGQVVRFTSAGRLLGESKRFSVSTDRTEYTLGESVSVLARVLGRDFKPTRAEEQILSIDAGQDSPEFELTAVQNPARPEYYEVTLDAKELGEHTIVLAGDGSEPGAQAKYRVVVPQLEYENPTMDRPRLQEIARLSGGAYHEISEARAVIEEVKPFEKEVPISEERSPLWDEKWLLILFVSLLTAEWLLRKVFRLL